jgi:D-glycero-D-manno-heptose 1,7-bisphosphate phosphatase
VSDRWLGSYDRGLIALPTAGRTGVAPGRPAAFLDRDGTLNETVRDPDSGIPESPLKVADVRLIPGAADAACTLVEAGYALVCVSNQPAAAKGKVTVPQLLAVHERVIALLETHGVRVDASRLCLHHPDGVVDELSGPCTCRKPGSGMLLDAASALGLDLGSSWMLGDTDTDVVAGRAAGCRTVLIEYPQSAHKRLGDASPDLRAPDLAAGVAQLLDIRSR